MSDKSHIWNAEGYANHSSPQQEWGMDLFSKLSLEGNERLLDIGCGDGKITVEIARSLPEGSIVGIDNSQEMIELAHSTYPEKDFQNVSFRQIDARNLPFDKEFDVIFSNAALHWIQNHYPVLRGINRSLNPGGKVLLQMGGKGNGAEIIRAADEVTKSKKWEKYFTDFSPPYAFYGPKQYRRWLEKVGLQSVRTEMIPKMMIHDSSKALMDWLEKVFIPYSERISETQYKHFIKEVVEKYIEYHPPDEKGRTHVQMIRLEVEAKKVNV